MKKIEIITEDGRHLVADWLCSSCTLPALGIVVIHSATGVRRGYYHAFAQHLTEHSFDVLVWDARGIGESGTEPVRSDLAKMRDWGQRDQHAVLKHAKTLHPHAPLIIVGHSSGGHLAGLTPFTASADALILIASGSCDWRDYPRAQWPRLLAIWYVAMPIVLAIWGHVPAWAGLGHALPHGVAVEWRRWSLTRGYLFEDPTLDVRGYSAYAGPLLALSISDDQGFSPPGAVQSLLQRFSRAQIEHREISADLGSKGRIGHFGFFKQKNAILWPTVTHWLLNQVEKHKQDDYEVS